MASAVQRIDDLRSAGNWQAVADFCRELRAAYGSTAPDIVSDYTFVALTEAELELSDSSDPSGTSNSAKSSDSSDPLLASLDTPRPSEPPEYAFIRSVVAGQRAIRLGNATKAKSILATAAPPVAQELRYTATADLKRTALLGYILELDDPNAAKKLYAAHAGQLTRAALQGPEAARWASRVYERFAVVALETNDAEPVATVAQYFDMEGPKSVTKVALLNAYVLFLSHQVAQGRDSLREETLRRVAELKTALAAQLKFPGASESGTVAETYADTLMQCWDSLRTNDGKPQLAARDVLKELRHLLKKTFHSCVVLRHFVTLLSHCREYTEALAAFTVYEKYLARRRVQREKGDDLLLFLELKARILRILVAQQKQEEAEKHAMELWSGLEELNAVCGVLPSNWDGKSVGINGDAKSAANDSKLDGNWKESSKLSTNGSDSVGGSSEVAAELTEFVSKDPVDSSTNSVGDNGVIRDGKPEIGNSCKLANGSANSGNVSGSFAPHAAPHSSTQSDPFDVSRAPETIRQLAADAWLSVGDAIRFSTKRQLSASERSAQTSRAIEAYRRCVALKYAAKPAFRLARLYAEAGDRTRAISVLRRSLSRVRHFDSWHLLALLLSVAEDGGAAARVLETVLQEAQEDIAETSETCEAGMDEIGTTNGKLSKPHKRKLSVTERHSLLKMRMTLVALTESRCGAATAVAELPAVFTLFHELFGYALSHTQDLYPAAEPRLLEAPLSLHRPSVVGTLSLNEPEGVEPKAEKAERGNTMTRTITRTLAAPLRKSLEVKRGAGGAGGAGGARRGSKASKNGSGAPRGSGVKGTSNPIEFEPGFPAEQAVLRQLWLWAAELYKRADLLIEAEQAVDEAAGLKSTKAGKQAEAEAEAEIHRALGFLALGQRNAVALQKFEMALERKGEDLLSILGLASLFFIESERDSGFYVTQSDLTAGQTRVKNLLETATECGAGVLCSEAWWFLSRAYEVFYSDEKLRETLWRVVALEEGRPVRPYEWAETEE